VRQKAGLLRIEVDAPEVLHVTYGPLDSAAPERSSDHVVVRDNWPATAFEVVSDEKTVTLSTEKLRVVRAGRCTMLPRKVGWGVRARQEMLRRGRGQRGARCAGGR
jgi:hypothetical protein